MVSSPQLEKLVRQMYSHSPELCVDREDDDWGDDDGWGDAGDAAPGKGGAVAEDDDDDDEWDDEGWNDNGWDSKPKGSAAAKKMSKD